MAIPQIIKSLANDIRTKITGKDVRESLAKGIEEAGSIADESNSRSKNTEHRQTVVETQFDDVLAGWSEDNTVDNAETIAGRTNRKTGKNYKTIGDRLDEENEKLTFDLVQTENYLADLGVNVKKNGASGEGAVNDTVPINLCVAYVSESGGGEVLIPDGIYLVDPISTSGVNNVPNGGIITRDNVKLKFSKNAFFKAIPNEKGSYSVINVLDVENVIIDSPRIIGERNEHTGTTGEWGHGISINGSTNVTVLSPDIKDCWGDGIYIGRSDKKNYSENVKIIQPICDNNRRQGISIVSVKDLTIENPLAKNTNGTAPSAGIDIEPNGNTDRLENILIINPVTENNEGSGIIIAPDRLTEGGVSQSISIKIVNPKSRLDREGIYFAGMDELSANLTGSISIDDLDVYQPRLSGFRAENWLKEKHPTVFINKGTVRNPNGRNQTNLGNRGRAGYVIYAKQSDHDGIHGGFEFVDCQTIDDRDPNTDSNIMIVKGFWFEVSKTTQRIDANVHNPYSNYSQGRDGIIRWEKGFGSVNYNNPPLNVLHGDSSLSDAPGTIIQQKSLGDLLLPPANDCIDREFLFRYNGNKTRIKPVDGDRILGFDNMADKRVDLDNDEDFLRIKSIGDKTWMVVEQQGRPHITGEATPRRVVFGYGPPTSGNWRIGDRVLNAEPNSGYYEWICRSSGNPGVWVGHGRVDN